MQEFSNVANDFSNESFQNCSLGAGLLDNVFSESEVKRISSSSNPVKEIEEAFSKLIPFKQGPLKECPFIKSGLIMKQLPEAYYNSASFKTGEVIPPFEMLENYVQDLAKTKGVLPRVNRTEMYERETFIVELSNLLFESNSNIGAICFFGSFVRGRKNPQDIDMAVYFKKAYPMGFVEDTNKSWEGPKSKGLMDKIPREIFISYRPDRNCEKSVTEMDNAFCVIEDYQDDTSSLFKKLDGNNDHRKVKNFKINALLMPYQHDFAAHYISGGHIWVINNKGKDNYKAFFSLGENFTDELDPDDLDDEDKVYVP